MKASLSLLRVLVIMILMFLLGVIMVLGLILFYSLDLPKITTLSDYAPAVPSRIYAKDGTVLAELGKETRFVVPVSEVPQVIINAFLAAEDDNFYNHKGVDYWGLLRASLANLKAGRIVQGGSTITQQVAKSLLLSSERSYARKIKDFLLAQKIEKNFSKEEILFLYLNQVYLGGGHYGVKAAFKGYFNKELSEATIAESAIIAGLLVAPGKYSPYLNPRLAQMRKQYVLKRLYETKKISEEEYQSALKEPLKFRTKKKETYKAPYFTDWVRQRVVEKVGEEAFLTRGFEIQTTLDLDLQNQAEKFVKEGVKELDKRQGFNGVMATLNLENDYQVHVLNFRKKVSEDKSEYFTISEDFQLLREIEIPETKTQEILDLQKEEDKRFRNQRFLAGYNKDDLLLNYLNVGETYDAVVLKVDDRHQIITVSVGGVRGLISYEGFKWAYPRKLDPGASYTQWINRPSTIVKVGDLIETKILKMKTTFHQEADKDSKKSLLETDEEVKLLKTQNYLLCELDQTPKAEGALLSLSETGEILSLVGGYDFARSQFNRAIQSQRQPGSSVKPILYAVALENGFTLSTILNDSPRALGGLDDSLSWKPKNYDNQYLGDITFRMALEQSRNVPTVEVAEKVGVAKIKKFVERLGLALELPNDLSVALGSFGITLMDLTSTYAMFPQGGKLVDPVSIKSIQDKDGNVFEIDEQIKKNRLIANKDTIFPHLAVPPSGEQSPEEAQVPSAGIDFTKVLTESYVYEKRLSYLMTSVLKGVVQSGTGAAAKDLGAVAGKTGTTNEFVDALFIGFSPRITTGVWVGFDDNTCLGYGETGARAALPIWKNFMSAALQKFPESDFDAPRGIVNVLIDKKTGRPAKQKVTNAFMEVYVDGTGPTVNQSEELMSDELKKDELKEIYEDDDYYNAQ